MSIKYWSQNVWNLFLSGVNYVYYGLKASIPDKYNDLFLSGRKK